VNEIGKKIVNHKNIWEQPDVDLILTVEWEGCKRFFLTELGRTSTPRALEDAIRHVKAQRCIGVIDMSSRERTNLWPIVIAPYLSDESLNRLIEAKVSGLDLSGNGVIIVPGTWFILKTGAKNRFPSNAPIKNIYRGASSIVTRTFFLKAQFSSVTEVSEEIQKRGGSVSLSTVSKVLKVLQEELIVSRDENIKLIQPEKLLDLLTKNYIKPKIKHQILGKTDQPEKFYTRERRAEDKRLFVASRSQTPYVIMPSSDVTSIYTTSISYQIKDTDFKENSRFPNIELVETDDPTIYFDRREYNGKYYISPIQAYLELATGGKRERETAEQMREDITNFRYK
jgi:hypothetical protein